MTEHAQGGGDLSRDPAPAHDHDAFGRCGTSPQEVGVLEPAQGDDAVKLAPRHSKCPWCGAGCEQQPVEAQCGSVGKLEPGVGQVDPLGGCSGAQLDIVLRPVLLGFDVGIGLLALAAQVVLGRVCCIDRRRVLRQACAACG